MPSKTTPVALAQGFDSLADTAAVPDKTVAHLLNVSSQHVWNMVKDGLLPKPFKVSQRCTRFNVGQLRQSAAFGGGRAQS